MTPSNPTVKVAVHTNDGRVVVYEVERGSLVDVTDRDQDPGATTTP